MHRPGRFVFILVLVLVCGAVRGEFPTSRPYEQVLYQHEQRRDPDMSLHVVIVDLRDPNVSLHVSPGGPDPDGPGKWQTKLMPVSQIARRDRLDVAINAGFFAVPTTQEAPQFLAGYVPGKPAAAIGLTMTDGQVWSSGHDDWPVVCVSTDRKVHIGLPSQAPVNARQIVAGNAMVLDDAQPAEFKGMMTVRHPRTVVGIDRDSQKLVLLIVDGRRPGVSVGMTGQELAIEMLRLGCWDAVNLDGGGSTTLVMRDPQTDQWVVLNQPSGNGERPVASALGVKIGRARARPVTQPAR